MNEQDRDREWLGELTSLDLTDLSFGTFDLSRGSTNEWWEQVEEIPMDSRFNYISTKELEDELKRRKDEKEAKIEYPVSLENPDWQPLMFLCASYVVDTIRKGWVDDDLPHYIFEQAIQCLYGEDIFRKLSKIKGVTNDTINDR